MGRQALYTASASGVSACAACLFWSKAALNCAALELGPQSTTATVICTPEAEPVKANRISVNDGFWLVESTSLIGRAVCGPD